MSGQSAATPAPGLSARSVLGLWLAIGVALAVVLAAAGVILALPPLPGRPQPDALTVVVALLGDLVARLAAACALGLLAALVVVPAQADGTPSPRNRVLSRWLVRSAQVWLAAAVGMTIAHPSFVEGVAIGDALRPEAWWLFLTTTTSVLAWVASVLVAVGIVLVGRHGRSRAAFLLGWLAAAAAAVFVAVTGNVSVGLDHDWATDAVGLATLAAVVLASGAIGALALTAAGAPGEAALRRYAACVPPLLVVAAAGFGLAAWQQLGGAPVLSVAYGQPVLLGAAAIALLALGWLERRWRRHRDHSAAPASPVRDVALLAVGAAALTAAAHVPPPRFLLPQSIQVNYLGYEVLDPATFERLTGLGRPNLLWVVLSAGAIAGYAWAVVRVHRRGGRWPVGRLLSWTTGWLLTLYLAVSGLWMYSTAVFSWHMLVHMTVNMMVPVLCVLGAPLTLLAAASRPRSPEEPPGAEALLAELAGHRLVRVLLSPPLVWATYVFSLFAVYFSPLFPWLMRFHWGHQLMLLHFMVAGYAFFALLIGPDRHPWRLPHLVKFALLLSIMPFHAIFAVGIMSARSVLGEAFYRRIDVAWVGDLLADQGIAGQITWFTGEIPAFIAVVVLAAQWFRSDSRDAAAADRSADAGGDDELSAYNDLLAELARRDSGVAAPGRGDR